MRWLRPQLRLLRLRLRLLVLMHPRLLLSLRLCLLLLLLLLLVLLLVVLVVVLKSTARTSDRGQRPPMVRVGRAQWRSQGATGEAGNGHEWPTPSHKKV